MRIGLASSATAVRDNIDSARAPNITSFFIYNSCVRRLLLAAFDWQFRCVRTEVAGSLLRLPQGKLFLSDKYLYKSGSSIGLFRSVRHCGARTVGQDPILDKTYRILALIRLNSRKEN